MPRPRTSPTSGSRRGPRTPSGPSFRTRPRARCAGRSSAMTLLGRSYLQSWSQRPAPKRSSSRSPG
eukprot:8470294-Alexandrium_andersonii.AAC.1